MAKIDDILEQVSAGFQNSQVQFGTVMVTDEQMETYKIRRKQVGVTHHKVCYLSIGEMGGKQPAVFWGHKLSDCIKKALEWRNLPTKSKRGPKQPAQQQPQS